jgi:hypothetical protein
MGATVFTDRSNRREKACKKEESIYWLVNPANIGHVYKTDAGRGLQPWPERLNNASVYKT